MVQGHFISAQDMTEGAGLLVRSQSNPEWSNTGGLHSTGEHYTWRESMRGRAEECLARCTSAAGREDTVSPALIDTWAATRMTVADEGRHSWRVK